jgi:hypothetical protein
LRAGHELPARIGDRANDAAGGDLGNGCRRETLDGNQYEKNPYARTSQ